MDEFARRLLDWFERCGRHDLPWQTERSAYRVWVSEIMLQQTQVATVVPYFERFMARFPGVESLAAAHLDDVLALWAGLGYYARARNLHRAARMVIDEHGGELPRTLDGLVALPGIGRSTAGAILAQAHGLREPILDGNVRRVLARWHAVEGWPGERDVERRLWQLAERHTPGERVADYTQAIMDLGATVCVRRRPACPLCPVADDCRARRLGVESSLPAPRPKRERPRRRSAVLVIQDLERRVLLERRPERGIWGGLYSLPELGETEDARDWCRRRLGAAVRGPERVLPTIAHAFTHFDLDLAPTLLRLDTDCGAIMDADNLVWYNPASQSRLGLASPIVALLESLERSDLAAAGEFDDPIGGREDSGGTRQDETKEGT
ncbi:MAG: A/G-specific adenine glycosylase [Gammaproteobacteria bacterium]|nr:A/G-specific adenine glycosylase [Gammaproteobacteria bacterium]